MVTAGDRTPVHQVLDETECRGLLTSTTVGRVAVVGPEGVVLRPVNFRMVGGDVLFRVPAGGVVREVADRGDEVVFEIDHHGTGQSGWSVLVRGTATTGERAGELDDEDVRHPVPWGATGESVLVSLHPVGITGRSVRLAPSPPA